MIREGFLLFIQEPGLGGTPRQVEVNKKGEGHRQAALNDEEPSPRVVDQVGLDLKNSERKESAEGICYI